MPEIRAEQLGHVYRGSGVRALDGVDLQIAAGERVALVGQNGSGKSTLVRHLNGLLRPTSGRLLIDGADARPMRVAEMAAIVGVVFQDPDRQIFSRSVLDEVRFGPRNLGRSGEALRDAVKEALELSGLTGTESANPYDLGHSRRRMLSLASVLAMRTPVLVLDEPTTGQDRWGTRQVRAVIESVAAAGRTVIAVTHDMELAAEAFRRVVVMRSGTVVFDGSPTEAFDPARRDTLRSTNLDAPLPARVATRLGLRDAATEVDLVEAARRVANGQ